MAILRIQKLKQLSMRTQATSYKLVYTHTHTHTQYSLQVWSHTSVTKHFNDITSLDVQAFPTSHPYLVPLAVYLLMHIGAQLPMASSTHLDTKKLLVHQHMWDVWSCSGHNCCHNTSHELLIWLDYIHQYNSTINQLEWDFTATLVTSAKFLHPNF